MTARISKTYTLAITKTIVVDTDSACLEEAEVQTHKALLSGLYQEQWFKARASIELIEVGVAHG